MYVVCVCVCVFESPFQPIRLHLLRFSGRISHAPQNLLVSCPFQRYIIKLDIRVIR